MDEFFRLGPYKSVQQTSGVELRRPVWPARSARNIPRNENQAISGSQAAGCHKTIRAFAGGRGREKSHGYCLVNVRKQLLWCSRIYQPSKPAGVLARLQPNLQTDVIRRLVDLEETDPAVIAEKWNRHWRAGSRNKCACNG